MVWDLLVLRRDEAEEEEEEEKKFLVGQNGSERQLRVCSLQGHQHPCRGAMAFLMVQDHRLLVYKVVDAPGMQVVVVPGCIPVVAQRLLPTVQTVLVDKVVDAPVMKVVPGSHAVIFPVVTQRLIPLVQPVQRTIKISQLQFVPGGRCPCLAGHASSQVLVLRRQLSSHSCSFEKIVGVQVSLGQGGQCPCCAGRASSTGAVVEETVVLPQLHLS